MEFGKRHDTTDFCPCQLVMDLLRICCMKLWGNWCNGLWENLLREVANLLRTCYGETGLMDFDLYHTDLSFWCQLWLGMQNQVWLQHTWMCCWNFVIFLRPCIITVVCWCCRTRSRQNCKTFATLSLVKSGSCMSHCGSCHRSDRLHISASLEVCGMACSGVARRRGSKLRENNLRVTHKNIAKFVLCTATYL